MPSPTRIVLLACGSFNPITNMHLRLFELARDGLHKTGRFKVVAGIISPVNDKYSKKDLLPAHQRCAMVELALESSTWIRLDRWECERTKWSPTVEVLRHHKEVLDSTYNANLDSAAKRRKTVSNASADSDYASMNNINETPVELKLLCGADLLESFDVPNLWDPAHMEEIVSKFGIVCIGRSGSDAEKFIYNSDMLTRNRNNIHLITEWIQNDISATKIRRALRRGESVKYLVQDSVIEYIYRHQLYGAGDKFSVCNGPSNAVDSHLTNHINGTEKLQQRKGRSKHKL